MKTSWEVKKLGEVLDIQNGYAFKSSSYVPLGSRVIRISNVQSGHILDKNPKFVALSEKKEYLDFQIYENDILISLTGDVGRVGIFPKNLLPALLNQRVGKIININTEIISKEYLFLFLNSKYFESEVIKSAEGAAQKNTSTKKIKDIEIPIPPLSEQKRITETLDEVFEKVTNAKEAAERNLQNSRELFESYVKTVFANPGKDWEEKKLSELLEIERGGSPRPIQKFLTKDPDGINWIKIGDTKDSDKYITATAQKIKPEGLKKSRLVHPGDFLLSNSMSFGRPYILKITGAIHDGWLVLREKDPNLIDKDYLYNILGSAYVFSQFDKLAAGSTVRNLNINLVSGVRIPVPKISEQKAIVKKLDAMYAQTKRLGEIYEQKLADLEELKKSALSMAFSGKLSTVVDSVRVSPQIAVAVPSPYIRNQVHAAIVDQVVRDSGSTTEVAVAKYDHLLQELCGLSLGYQFATHQFGPFDNQIKRLVSSGLGKNKWFTKRSGMIVFGSNVGALLSRQSNLYRSAQASMKELSRLGITKLDADSIELLSTVCHSIKETGSVTIDAIRTFMSNWQTDNNARTKADKFSEERTQKCLDFILKNNLQQKLLPTT